MTEENKSKLKEMTIISNNCRGKYIGIFTVIEHTLADIVVHIDYEGDARRYFKTYKTANTIFKDFWIAFDKIKHNLSGKINYEFTFYSDLERLKEHRNILAHCGYLYQTILI